MAENMSRAEFQTKFSFLIEDIKSYCEKSNVPSPAIDWFIESLKYNTTGGKFYRGLSVPDTGHALLGRPLRKDEVTDLSILGWLTELLQAHFLVHDDIMDKSATRRGQPCWYQRQEVGLKAVNDGSMLHSAIFIVLKAHFQKHPSYVHFIEVFHDTTAKTLIGQLCDLTVTPEDTLNHENFTLETYHLLSQHKTSYSSFYLPVVLGLYYCELGTPRNLQQAHDILVPMGEYYQVQDDYLDAFGEPNLTGKEGGSDIENNKCSWIIVQALARCSEAQRQVLDECYGRKGSAVRVRQLFDTLRLQQVYREFEAAKLRELTAKIDAVDESEGLRKGVFELFFPRYRAVPTSIYSNLFN